MTESEVKNPNWGGVRPGAGRPSLVVKLTREEVQLLLRHIQGYKKDSPSGLLIGKLRRFADRG